MQENKQKYSVTSLVAITVDIPTTRCTASLVCCAVALGACCALFVRTEHGLESVLQQLAAYRHRVWLLLFHTWSGPKEVSLLRSLRVDIVTIAILITVMMMLELLIHTLLIKFPHNWLKQRQIYSLSLMRQGNYRINKGNLFLHLNYEQKVQLTVLTTEAYYYYRLRN